MSNYGPWEDAKEFLNELGYRFPNMSDYEVVLAYDEYTMTTKFHEDPESNLWRLILYNYNLGVTAWEDENREQG